MKKYNKTIALCALSLLFIASCAPSNSNPPTAPTVDASAVEISKSDAKIIFDACRDAYFNREKLANEYKIGKNAQIERELYVYNEYIEMPSNIRVITEGKSAMNFEFSFDDKYLNAVETNSDLRKDIDKNGNENIQKNCSYTTNVSINKVGEDDINYVYKEDVDSIAPENDNDIDINETYPYSSNFEKFHGQFLDNVRYFSSSYSSVLCFFEDPSYFTFQKDCFSEMNEKYYSKGEGSLIVEVNCMEGTAPYLTPKTLYYEFSNYLCSLYYCSSAISDDDGGEYSFMETIKFEYDNVTP